MHALLHNEAALACSEVVKILEDCHARGFLYKAFGNCNTAKDQVTACLRAERVRRQSNNRRTGSDNRAKWKQTLEELEMD